MSWASATTRRKIYQAGRGRVGFEYGYDAVGNRQYERRVDDPSLSESYGYDGVYRLVDWRRGAGAFRQRWALDKVGNWEETRYDGTVERRTHNEVNELLRRTILGDEEGLVYDADGNLVEDGAHLYTWDALNRLRKVRRKTDGAVVGRYSYDARNRRITRVALVEGAGVWRRYIYSGWQVVEERGEAGEVTAAYTYGPYIDEPITLSTAAGTYYYHSNALYSTFALTDASGDIVEKYLYTPYGRPGILAPDGSPRARSAVGNAYMFTGRRFDPEAGMYDYRNRYYAPELGRFVSRDPAGYADAFGYGKGLDKIQGITEKLQDFPWDAIKCTMDVYEKYQDATPPKDSEIERDKWAHCMVSCHLGDCPGGAGIAFTLGTLKETLDAVPDWMFDLIASAPFWDDKQRKIIEKFKGKFEIEDAIADGIGIGCQAETSSCECCCEKTLKEAL